MQIGHTVLLPAAKGICNCIHQAYRIERVAKITLKCVLLLAATPVYETAVSQDVYNIH